MKHQLADAGGVDGHGFSAALCRGLIEADQLRVVAELLLESFPRLYAAASLKPALREARAGMAGRFSAALCRGLIEARAPVVQGLRAPGAFSAALCRGLIEARYAHQGEERRGEGFPRLYAAASLKRGPGTADGKTVLRFPRLYAAASLKRRRQQPLQVHSYPFSAALCRGLIEAIISIFRRELIAIGFPRLYAAASLKRLLDGDSHHRRREFSAALCRGLIEAP